MVLHWRRTLVLHNFRDLLLKWSRQITLGFGRDKPSRQTLQITPRRGGDGDKKRAAKKLAAQYLS